MGQKLQACNSCKQCYGTRSLPPTSNLHVTAGRGRIQQRLIWKDGIKADSRPVTQSLPETYKELLIYQRHTHTRYFVRGALATVDSYRSYSKYNYKLQHLNYPARLAPRGPRSELSHPTYPACAPQHVGAPLRASQPSGAAFCQQASLSPSFSVGGRES